MKEINVLLVEDEQTLAMIIKDTLEEEGFSIHTAADGEEGLRRCFELRPDVVVADVMMPRMDGFEMVRRLRQTDRSTPVLFLTARSAVGDVVEGFGLGANDYLKKPFGMQELIVRIKALVGRAATYREEEKRADEAEQHVLGDYLFNPVTQQLTFTGGDALTPQEVSSVELSHREAEILHRLCLNRSQVVNTRDLLLQLWGDDSFFNQRSLHVFITKLRHKLAKDARIRIVNVRGIGYKLVLATLLLLLAPLGMKAQSEVKRDTFSTHREEGEARLREGTGDEVPDNPLLSPEVRSYGGFLLDMGMMNIAPPNLSPFKLEIPDASKDYSRLFRLSPAATYWQAPANLLSPYPGSGTWYGTGYLGGYGFWNSTDQLQMGSFQLKNGWRVNTYGQYDKDGWRVPNPSALPWEKNNFKGAFELKSSNGNFGIRIEVQQGRKTPY